jgi:hypothetical protein
MIVNLALVMDGTGIRIGPRDVDTQTWLIRGGAALIDLTDVKNRWVMRGVSRRDLPTIAAEVAYELTRQQRERERTGPFEDVEFRVRACEYQTVEAIQELREI